MVASLMYYRVPYIELTTSKRGGFTNLRIVIFNVVDSNIMDKLVQDMAYYGSISSAEKPFRRAYPKSQSYRAYAVQALSLPLFVLQLDDLCCPWGLLPI